MSGWIKLHRGLIDWEWYTDHNTCRLFIHCIVRANYDAKNWRGISIARGQFWTSLPTLQSETGLSASQIRTSLNKLISTGEIAVKSQAQGRMVTVLEYESYQQDDRQNDNLVTDQSQTSDRPVTANKNVKKDKNVIIIPDGINQPAWNEWVAYRNSKKKTVSQVAAKKQFKLLANYAFEVQQQIIDQSIQNDYQGLFEPKGNTNEVNQRSNQPRKSSVVDRVHARANEREQARRAEERALDGQVVGEASGSLRPPAQQPVRGDNTPELGRVIDGNYTRTD